MKSKARPVDHEGRPFVTQMAPRLRFEIRKSPHRYGIDYPFAEQTARGAALFNRFPPFSLSDRRIHISGPWYDSDEANGHFAHGITSIEAMPNFRQGATDVRRLPSGEKWQLLGDPLFWSVASRWADSLATAHPEDSRIPALRTFSNDHRFTPNEAAFTGLGRQVWEGESFAADAKGEGSRYAMIDIEQTGGWEYQRQCFGWLYRGMEEAAVAHGLKIVPVTYGQWTFSVGAVWESDRRAANEPPEFLKPEKDFLATPDPTLKIVNELNGVVSMDGYMQAIWGREPFYKRNEDGSLVMVNGKPVFNDATRTTLYGEEISLEPGEAEHCLQDLYRQAARMYLMYHWLAGDYPTNSELRKPFLKDVRIGAWTRITNEGLLGIQQNDRPLPSWLLETLTEMYLFTADDLVVWSSDFNAPPGPLGADRAKTWKYEAHGVIEPILKAAHRYGVLDPIHHGSFRWCWFHLPLVDKNQTDGERYDQKPIAFGKIREYQGKPWLELFAAWPAIDSHPADMKLWIEKDGKRSPTYSIRLKDGRTSFYDGWELPAFCKNIEGKDVRLQFKDESGVTRTWRGDWREKTN